MVGSLEQINQSLTVLDGKVDDLREQFRGAYTQYLKLLAPVIKQQLVLSCYHICTEGFPQRFLALSVSQRQRLQDSIRELAQHTEHDLLDALETAEAEAEEATDLAIALAQPTRDLGVDLDEPEEAEGHLNLEFLAADEDEEDDFEHDFENEFDNDDDDDDDDGDLDDDGEDALEELEIEDANALEALLSKALADRLELLKPKNSSETLYHWHLNVERTIAKSLQVASQATNRLLQNHEILPKQVPPPVLEAAAKAKGTDASSTQPNVLNLLIEAGAPPKEKSEKSGPTALVHVMAVSLRLSEIEFNDMTVMSGRNRLRDLKQQLQLLVKDHQKKQREQSIAEARLAWKSTWTNE